MIKLELSPDTPWYDVSTRVGTVHHSRNGVAAGVHQDFKSTLKTRRYMCGLEPPNYPMPAIVARVGYFDCGIEWLRHSPIGGYSVVRDWEYI